VITLVETAYDDPVAVELVAALRAEINERYAYAMVDMTEAERAEDDAAVAAQVAPADVRAPNGAFLVAWLDGAPVGCGAVMALDRPGGVAEVKRMYTVPGGRRRGVSQAVLAALETRAAELGYRWLQLETGLAQPEAMALYERAGWRRITPYGRYQDSPETACYGKDLGSPPAPASHRDRDGGAQAGP